MGLATEDAIELDNCILNGMPFFFAGHENFSTGEDKSDELTMNTINAIVNSGKAIPDINKTDTGKRILTS